MRILLDARTVGKEFSGVGNYVLELVRAFSLLDEDLEVSLCVHGESRLRDLELDRRFRFVEAAFSHESHPLGDAWEHWILPRLARHLRAEVLHGPAFLIPTRRTAAAKVVTVHDLVAFSQPLTIPRKYAFYMQWLIRRVVRTADRVITDSEYVRQEIVKTLGTDPERVESIPLGVSGRFSPAASGETERVRRRYGLDAPYLLFVGNLEPRKNLPGLVDAFRHVRAAHGEPLLLAVSGQMAWLSRSLLPALGAEDVAADVRALGFVDAADLPALYAGAEVFVFPSFSEGFGLPVLEAMACGVPVVASRVSSIPEVADDAAVLVDPESTEAIAAGILQLLQSPELRADCSRRGLARAKAFPWEGTARRTLAAYRTARDGRTR